MSCQLRKPKQAKTSSASPGVVQVAEVFPWFAAAGPGRDDEWSSYKFRDQALGLYSIATTAAMLLFSVAFAADFTRKEQEEKVES